MTTYGKLPGTKVIALSVVLTILVYLIHVVQKKGAPRLFLNRFFAQTTIHDYFGQKEEFENQNHVVELCAICYKDVREKVVLDKRSQVAYLSPKVLDYISKKDIKTMRTPCNHTFHAACLLTSMSYKMMCPTCRRRLPNVF